MIGKRKKTASKTSKLKINQGYASLWMRFNAFMIDFFFLLIPVYLIEFIVRAGVTAWMSPFDDLDRLITVEDTLSMIGQAGLSFLYFAFMQSKVGYTLGKKAVGLRVATQTMQKVPLPQMALRWALMVPSLSLFGIGFFAAFFSETKQTLYDRFAGTVVVREGLVKFNTARTSQSARKSSRLKAAA